MNPELKKLLARLRELQDQYKGKQMPENVGEEFAKLASEAKAMQDEADRETEIKRFERFAAEVPNPAVPETDDEREGKSRQSDVAVAGYITPGALFVNSEAFAAYKRAGNPLQRGSEAVDVVEMVTTRDGKRFVPLSREQRKAVEHAVRESKAVPTLGTGVIEPQRVDPVVTPRGGFARIRDLVSVRQTGSASVQFFYRASHTNAAAVVAPTAAKPESASAYSLQTANVRTIAEWMPVTEQQLEDVPAIIAAINVDLLADLDDTEEVEMMYGAGTGEHFLGMAVDPAVVDGRTSVGDTVLDKIRRGVTDVRKKRYRPNGAIMDPVDWEAAVLLKGSDDRYIFSIVTDADGDRIWGLRVVETPAAENTATDERNILVGDFQRGAALWVRSESQIAMGWINDQFIKNMRTIRAERRAAFAVRAGGAIVKIETNPAS
jgi:HK97 family phage major capsid protein